MAPLGNKVSHTQDGFDITDGTGFISIRSGDKPPPLASRVMITGTLSGHGDRTYIAAKSVKEL